VLVGVGAERTASVGHPLTKQNGKLLISQSIGSKSFRDDPPGPVESDRPQVNGYVYVDRR